VRDGWELLDSRQFLLEYSNELQLRGINETWMSADSQGTIGIHSSKGGLSIELNYVATTFRTE
jgi:hypothetical protein